MIDAVHRLSTGAIVRTSAWPLLMQKVATAPQSARRPQAP
jgi:hypothetical protein